MVLGCPGMSIDVSPRISKNPRIERPALREKGAPHRAFGDEIGKVIRRKRAALGCLCSAGLCPNTRGA